MQIARIPVHFYDKNQNFHIFDDFYKKMRTYGDQEQTYGDQGQKLVPIHIRWSENYTHSMLLIR